MRLSTILSEYDNNELRHVESIINSDKYYDPDEIMFDEDRKPVENGSVVDIDIGTLVVHFFCSSRNDNVTYKSSIQHCLVVNNKVLSIDCMLECIDCDRCPNCKRTIQAWFLVEADNIFSDNPSVRILKYNFKVPEDIKFLYETSDAYAEWFAKADYAYREGLGAGSVIYLRTIFEHLTIELGELENINIYKPNGTLKPFMEVLSAVDGKCSIIPELYKQDGYNLFRKLSNIAHGNASEQEALENYLDLKRLVRGIIDNVNKQREEIRNNEEIKQALVKIGLCCNENGGRNE